MTHTRLVPLAALGVGLGLTTLLQAAARFARERGVPAIAVPATGLLGDTLGRPLRDLRISVTARCDLRCRRTDRDQRGCAADGGERGQEARDREQRGSRGRVPDPSGHRRRNLP